MIISAKPKRLLKLMLAVLPIFELNLCLMELHGPSYIFIFSSPTAYVKHL